MIVGGRNPSKFTGRRVGVCVLCTENITQKDTWKRISRPATGPAHEGCISGERS